MIYLLFLAIYLAIALLPAIAAIRFGKRIYIPICAILGLIGFLIIPYIIACLLATKNLPKKQPSKIPAIAYSAYWAVILLEFLFLPYMHSNQRLINGLVYCKIAFATPGLAAVIFFVGTVALSIAISAFLTGKWLMAIEPMLYMINIVFFLLFGITTYNFKMQSIGASIQLILLIAGIILLYYHTVTTMSVSAKSLPHKSASQNINVNAYASTVLNESKKAAHVVAKKAAAVAETVAASTSESAIKNQAICVRCTSGEYVGAAFTLKPGKSIMIGTDPGRCNLILSDHDISRLHCAIYCSNDASNAIIIDSSTNGTYQSNGSRLQKNTPQTMSLPCTIFFGQKPERFEITAVTHL